MSDDQIKATPPESVESAAKAAPPVRRKRTPEEIQAQREAMLAKRRAREAGGDGAEEPAVETASEVVPQTEAAPQAEAAAAAPPPASRKRTPEEIRAQREAMLAKRRAKAAGGAAAAEKSATVKAEATATTTPAAQPAPAKAAPARKAPAAKPAAKKPAAKRAARPRAATFERPKDVTRREFLNLAWLGSIALLSVQTLGVSILFLFPRFKEGEFGGIFNLGTASTVLPEKGSTPRAFNDGKFWLTSTDKGIYALYKVCTHLGCLYAWADVTHRFECPCHGSKFTLTGKYIEGPAPRSLDRFKIIATRPDGSIVETPPNGAGIELNGDETLAIDTGVRIKLPGKIEV